MCWELAQLLTSLNIILLMTNCQSGFASLAEWLRVLLQYPFLVLVLFLISSLMAI